MFVASDQGKFNRGVAVQHGRQPLRGHPSAYQVPGGRGTIAMLTGFLPSCLLTLIACSAIFCSGVSALQSSPWDRTQLVGTD